MQTNVHRNQEEQSSRRISLGTIIDPTTPGQEVPPVSPPVAPAAPPIFEPVTPSITSLPPTSPPAGAAGPGGGATTDLTNPEYMNVEPRLQPPVSSISQHILPITSPTTPTSMEPNMVN